MPEPSKRPSMAALFKRNLGLKIVAGAAAGMILCLGICQLGFYLGRNIHDGAPSGIDALGGIGFLLFAFLLIVGILIAVLESLGTKKR